MRQSNPTARYSDLDGAHVFISGGASGIGADMVRAFHGQQARVTFIDINAEAGDALLTELTGTGGTAPDFMACDITDIPALTACIDRSAERAGRLDVIINNAALDLRQDSLEVTPDQFDASIAVNLRHQYFGCTAAFKWMKPAGRGSMINFSSAAPTVRVPGLAVYSTCKSAVTGMSRTLAREFGGDGIRVNTIVPGAIITQRQLDLWISPEEEARIQAEQCLQRRLIGEDVAAMALFLGSDVSSACTSQSFTVDGGLI